MSNLYNATVVAKYDITPELFLLRVAPDAGIPDFTPGQYVAVGLLGNASRCENSKPDLVVHDPEKVLKRAYSIGSSPLNKDYLELYVAMVPDGGLTPRLAALNEGERLFVGPKITGTFTLNAVPDKAHVIMIATGTGLAPFVSMLRTPSCWRDERTFTIIHGVRYLRDLAYREELEELARNKENFNYAPIVSREQPPVGVNFGRVLSLFESGVVPLNLETDQVLLCGNPAMIEDAEAYLVPLGYSVHSKKNPTGNLHLEKYW